MHITRCFLWIITGSFFRVTCSTQTSSNDLTSNITCIESADSDRIEHYEYSINGGVIQTGMICSAQHTHTHTHTHSLSLFPLSKGTKFPLVINRTRLDFGDSTIDLTLYSVNRDTASVRLILSRNRPFSVQCGAVQSDDGSTVIISCFPTVPESQTISRLQYSINGAEQKFSVLGEDLPVSISVADLNVGQENTFLLILTGSDLAELTISLALQVQGEAVHISHSKEKPSPYIITLLHKPLPPLFPPLSLLYRYPSTMHEDNRWQYYKHIVCGREYAYFFLSNPHKWSGAPIWLVQIELYIHVCILQ